MSKDEAVEAMFDEMAIIRKWKGTPTIADDVALEMYGMTQREAQLKGICLRCRRPIALDEIHVPVERHIAVSAFCNRGICYVCQMEEEPTKRGSVGELDPGA